MKEAMTADQLLSWIRDNTSNHAEDSQLKAALWFVSMHVTQEALGAYDAKDWAFLAQTTENPFGGPYQKREDLDRWIASLKEMAQEYEEDEDCDWWSWSFFEPKLRDHFGV